MEPLLPRYDGGTLANVLPSLLAGFDVPGTHNTLGLPRASRVCLLLLDGLGWQLLAEHAAYAPFLSSLAVGTQPITAGFPATTATSIAALGTGLASGEHGLVGYSFAAGEDELLNTLSWQRHGPGKSVDLRSTLVPEDLQPHPTMLARAAAAGVAVRVIAPRELAGSGLTRAALRGGRYVGVHALGDLATSAVAALHDSDHSLCYAYHADIDLLGHVLGPGSDAWCLQLSYVDQMAASIAERLPSGGMLVVTADHGMVSVGEPDRVDFDTDSALSQGVRMLGGEARVRHVYTEPGAAEDARMAWRESLADRAWVLHREEAIAAGWFGPRVEDRIRPRIGDLVVAARGGLAVVRSQIEPRLATLVGHHGSLTADEQLIPLLVCQND